MVINDYEKAKSLFGKTEVQVFKKCKIHVLLLDLLLSFYRKNVECVLQRMLYEFLVFVYMRLSLKCKAITSKITV